MPNTQIGADDRSLTTIEVIPRQEFIDEWDYQDGQHVTMLGPTQRGKTTLAIQLLGKSATPDRKAVLLAGKPPGRDKVMGEAAKNLNLRVVEEWPPLPSYKDRKRNGFVLRPKQGLRDLDEDRENVRSNFRRALMSNYASKKPVITVVDEAHHVQNDLKLKNEYEAPLMRGAPVNSEWSLIQRGRWMSYLCYDAPEHVFIFYDPDISNQRRYSEIGGVDPEFIRHVVKNLKTYRTPNGMTVSECLYIRRSGPQLYIVDTGMKAD